jgi:hypothetical protein
MVLNPIFLRWSLVYNTSVLFFTLSFGGMGGWPEPNETNFILKNHILRRSLRIISPIPPNESVKNNTDVL